MAINFSVGEFVVRNRAYVEEILPSFNCGCTKQTLGSLGYIGANPSEVMATGNVFTGGTVKSFIRVKLNIVTNPAFRSTNNGIVIYFCSDEHLNNSLELSTAYLDDKVFVKAINVSGGPITKGQLVRQVGFDGTEQLPTINLASAAASGTCAVMGVAVSDVADTEVGSILIQGSYNGLDTSGFGAVGDLVFLSNTPGEISVTAGTEEKLIGRVLILSTEGSISLIQSLGGTGGGGGGFFTDGVGLNAGVGKGTVAPTAAGENALSQGDAAVADGNNSFALGYAVSAAANNSVAIGDNNTIVSGATSSFAHGNSNSITGGEANFASGTSNTIDDDYGFVQGLSNTLYNNDSFAQGENNTAYGPYSMLQGRDNTTNGSESFAQGFNNQSYGDRSFVQGRNNEVNGDFAFAQGEGNTIESDYSFAQGWYNYVYDQASFAQGYDNYIGPGITPTYNFAQGGDIRIRNGERVLAQGYNIDINYYYTNTANDILAQGSYINLYNGDHSHVFAQGRSLNIYSPSSSVFVQGYENTLDGDNNYIFVQGADNSVDAYVNASFVQGYDNSVDTSNSFAQGWQNTVNDLTSMAQGYNNFIGPGDTNNFAQGTNNYIGNGENCFAQGYEVEIYAGFQVFAQGSYIAADSSAGFDGRTNVFAQGNNLTVENSTSHSFVQGYYNTIDGYQVFVQGRNSDWGGSGLNNCFAQGYNNNFTGILGYQVMVQGLNNSVGGEASNIFIQGQNNSTAFQFMERCFLQGAYAEIRQSDQKVWGSNRTSPVGGAQSSHVVKYAETTDATPIDLAAVTTVTDKTYAITCIVVARNTTTAAESASFILSQATVYNDAGTSVLIGTPTFTSDNSGGGSATWTVDIVVSGADFRIEIVGDATDTVEWCCDLQFVEVAG